MQLQPYPVSIWHHIIPYYLHQYAAISQYGQHLDLIRMKNEKEVLEQGLAECAIYLQALRKKQARNERQLDKVGSLPRKKQKQLQQTKRSLERDMKNRERDEKAFLHNLQACRARLSSFDMLKGCDTFPSIWINTASTPTLCTPTLYSASSTETMDSSWNSWDEETVGSLYRGLNSNSFHSADVLSHKDLYRTKHGSATALEIDTSCRIFQSAEDLVLLPPVPPNTARMQILRLELDPEANIFDPGFAFNDADSFSGYPGSRVNPLPTSCDTPMPRRRLTDAGIDALHIQAGPHLQPPPSHTWCTITPQHSPTKDMLAPQSTRPRANSV